jgi:hypothetical protein
MILLLLVTAFFQPGQDCRSCEALMGIAGALSNSDGPRFMDYIDKSAPAYEDIQTDVTALTAQNTIAASLDVLKESGDDQHVEALVDWYMQINSDDMLEHATRRRMRVTVVERKIKGHWKVVSITPLSILDPVTTTK